MFVLDFALYSLSLCVEILFAFLVVVVVVCLFFFDLLN